MCGVPWPPGDAGSGGDSLVCAVGTTDGTSVGVFGPGMLLSALLHTGHPLPPNHSAHGVDTGTLRIQP